MTQATLLSAVNSRPAPASAREGSPLSSARSQAPENNRDGFARALDSASRETRELRHGGKAASPPPDKSVRGADKPQTEPLQAEGDSSTEVVLSQIDADVLNSLTDKQRSELEALVKKLQQALEQGGDPEAVIAELENLASKADEGQWPEGFSDWLTQKLQLLEQASAGSQVPTSEPATTAAVSSFLSAINQVVRQSSDRSGDKSTGSGSPVLTLGGAAGTESAEKAGGQGTSDLLSRLQGLLKDNGQARGQGENGLMAGQSGLDKNLEEGKLLDVVKLASSLAGSAGGAESRSDSISASSLTALAEAAGQSRTNPSPVATPKAQPMQAPVLTGFNQPGWSDSVGQKVLWLARQNISSAELRLDPPDLGPVNVRVSVQNDQAQVTFTSQHLVVREALDQSANRLRDMFASQGIDLVDVDVSDQSESQPESTLADSQSGRSGGGGEPDLEGESEGEALPGTGERGGEATVSLVDDYA